jgi:Tfp pilus assembly protein PilN
MFQINLVPEVQQQKQTQAKRNTYATFFSVSLIVITISGLVIMGAIKIGQDVSLKSTQTKIDSVKAESEQYKELEETVLSLEAGLNGVKDILGGKNNWTRLLPHMEAAMPSDVAYTSLEINGNLIKAELKGKTVGSLARFIESYKSYKVVSLSGVTTPGLKVEVVIGDSDPVEVTSNSLGKWTRAITFNPDSNIEIVVKDGEKETKLSYSAEKKLIESSDPSIGAALITLFENMNTTRYEKEETGWIRFDATFNFNEGALW